MSPPPKRVINSINSQSFQDTLIKLGRQIFEEPETQYNVYLDGPLLTYFDIYVYIDENVVCRDLTNLRSGKASNMYTYSLKSSYYCIYFYYLTTF